MNSEGVFDCLCSDCIVGGLPKPVYFFLDTGWTLNSLWELVVFVLKAA